MPVAAAHPTTTPTSSERSASPQKKAAAPVTMQGVATRQEAIVAELTVRRPTSRPTRARPKSTKTSPAGPRIVCGHMYAHTVRSTAQSDCFKLSAAVLPDHQFSLNANLRRTPYSVAIFKRDIPSEMSSHKRSSRYGAQVPYYIHVEYK